MRKNDGNGQRLRLRRESVRGKILRKIIEERQKFLLRVRGEGKPGQWYRQRKQKTEGIYENFWKYHWTVVPQEGHRRSYPDSQIVLDKTIFESENVQNAFDQLQKEIPGTDQWKERSDVVLSKYRDQMIQHGDTEQKENLELATKMLEPEGYLYSQRQSELRSLDDLLYGTSDA